MKAFYVLFISALVLTSCVDPLAQKVGQIKSTYEKALSLMESVEKDLRDAGDSKTAAAALRRYNQAFPQVSRDLAQTPNLGEEKGASEAIAKDVKPLMDKMSELSQKLLSTITKANLKFADDPEYTKAFMESSGLRP